VWSQYQQWVVTGRCGAGTSGENIERAAEAATKLRGLICGVYAREGRERHYTSASVSPALMRLVCLS